MHIASVKNQTINHFTINLCIVPYQDFRSLTGSNDVAIGNFVRSLNTTFYPKDPGELSYFLGIEVVHKGKDVLVSQRNYILDLLKKSHMECANELPTPMVSNCNLSAAVVPVLVKKSNSTEVLQYVVITRPNVAFAVNKICQFMHKPLDVHFTAVKRILRYLKGTVDYGLEFKAGARVSTMGFADANWGVDLDDKRSTTGYCLFLWQPCVLHVVSQSTAEVEYRSVAYTTAGVLWLESLLSELQVKLDDKPVLCCDNSSAVVVAANPVMFLLKIKWQTFSHSHCPLLCLVGYRKAGNCSSDKREECWVTIRVLQLAVVSFVRRIQRRLI
ncbi:hypothetical protein EPI10_014467 [Gossypium australe]|uniref:Reverse transcriptase Ty1/copia-type domain-containing protein n=1 Tax=Gossypium australe TaxID=47621 RepID=A0A5B6VHQ7_9ROSI|nr:hypothetical protein EPI10_014467 [Gossypium australe]